LDSGGWKEFLKTLFGQELGFIIGGRHLTQEIGSPIQAFHLITQFFLYSWKNNLLPTRLVRPPINGRNGVNFSRTLQTSFLYVVWRAIYELLQSS